MASFIELAEDEAECSELAAWPQLSWRSFKIQVIKVFTRGPAWSSSFSFLKSLKKLSISSGWSVSNNLPANWRETLSYITRNRKRRNLSQRVWCWFITFRTSHVCLILSGIGIWISNFNAKTNASPNTAIRFPSPLASSNCMYNSPKKWTKP